MAEKLGFEQSLGDGCAIDGDKRLVRPDAETVDGLRDQLLARAALAQQQDSDVRLGNALYIAQYLEHFRAGADDPGDRRLRRHRHQAPVLLFQFINAAGSIHDESQKVRIDRFAEEIVSAQSNGPDGVFAVFVSGDHNDFGFRSDLQQLFHRGQALGRPVRIGRQPEIDDRDRRPLALERFDRLAARAGQDHSVLRQQPAVLRAHAFVIIKDENGCPCAAHLPATFCETSPPACTTAGTRLGSVIRMMVPCPTALITSSSPPLARTISRAWKAPMP